MNVLLKPKPRDGDWPIILVLWMLLLCGIGFSGSASGETDIRPAISASGGSKVSQPIKKPFLILADVSGSMLETVSFQDKFGNSREMSKAQMMKVLLRDIFAQLGTASCATGIYRFWLNSGDTQFYRPFVDIGSHEQTEIMDRISDTFETDFPMFERLTLLGGTLGQLDDDLFESLHGQITVLLISDGEESFYDLETDVTGEESEERSKAVVQIRRIKEKYGDSFILHTVFLGRNKKKKREFFGEPLLKKLAELGSGKYFFGPDLFENQRLLDELCALACVDPADADNDGVADGIDKCPGTPEWVCADAEGCPGCRKTKEKRESTKQTDDAIRTPLDDWQPGPSLSFHCAEIQGETSDWRLQVQKGEKAHLVGNFESAAKAWEQALAYEDAKNDLCKYTETLIRLAGAYQAMGKHRDAIKILTANLPVVEKTDDPNVLALVWSTLADIHLSLGQTEESEACQTKVFEMINSVNNLRIFANIMLNAANSLAVGGDFDASLAYNRIILKYYEDSINFAHAEEIDPEQHTKVLLNVIRIKHQTMDYSDIDILLDNVFRRIMKLRDSVDKSAALISVAILCDDIRNSLDRSVREDAPKDNIRESVEFVTDQSSKVRINIPDGFTLKKMHERRFTIYFEFGEYTLSKQAKMTLEEIVKYLDAESKHAIHINLKGNTDAVVVRKDRKDVTSNLDLSIKRIQSIELYLKNRLALGYAENGPEIWKHALVFGEFSDKQTAMNESVRLKTEYGLNSKIAEKFRSGKNYHAVYAGEFDSEKAALDFSTRTFQKLYPAEKTNLIQTLHMETDTGGISVLKEAKGFFDPAVANRHSLSGTPENRRVGIEIAAFDSEREKISVELDKIQMDSKGRYVRLKNLYPLDELREENIYEKSLYRYLTETSYLALNEAQNVAKTLDIDRMSSIVTGHMSQLYKSERYDKKALDLAQQAVNEAKQGDFPEILYQWQWLLGREYGDAGEIEKAVAEYRRAITTLNPIRYKFFQGYRQKKNVFKESVKPVYLELAGLLLKQAEALPEGASRQQRLIEARDVVEMLKASELEDFFKDECVTRKEPVTASPNTSPPQTAIIHPIVLPEKLALLLTLPDGLRLVTVPVDEDTLTESVSRFRKKLQNRLNNRFIQEAEQLYDWIIRPIESELGSRGIHTLCFAPDGALRVVPMATLYDGQLFLAEKYAISIIPFMKAIDFDLAPRKKHHILLSGVSEARQEFSALPSIPVELSDIREIMAGETILMNEAFAIDGLKKAISEEKYSIFHIATHGVFGGTPEDSYLLAYNGHVNMNDLEELVGVARTYENSIDLLTLSACQTALGNERAAMGLAGVAVKAGVKSVLATLWYVDDEATSLAIREFYRQLKTPGTAKAKALQNAQKTLIANPRYWHPLYWAPFVLIGNWM